MNDRTFWTALCLHFGGLLLALVGGVLGLAGVGWFVMWTGLALVAGVYLVGNLRRLLAGVGDHD